MAAVVGGRLGVSVGGRMEAVQPRRSLFGPDYLRIAALVAVSAAVHLWLIGHTAVTARDSIGFGRYAISMQSPHATKAGEDPKRTALNVIHDAEHPPGFPTAVWAVAKVVRRLAPELPHPDAYLLSAQIASSLAAVLLVVPTYLIGRMLFGRFAGFAGALLLQVLPVPARITSDGLAEGVYLLAASVAVMLAVRAVRRPGVGGFLLCGMAVGASYLVRPEGLIVAGAVGVTVVGLALLRRWPWDMAAGRVVALAVGVALLAGPYMLLIGKVTNKPTGQDILNPGDNPRAKLFNARAAPVAGGPVFAAWWNPAVNADTNRLLWAVRVAGEETVKSLYYLPAGLAVLAVVALRRRVAADPGFWVLLAVTGLNAVLLLVLALNKGYVSERHTILLVMIGCVFAAAGLELLAAALPPGRFVAAGLVALVVVAALPNTLKPPHQNRAGHKHAGHWLAEHLQDGDFVIDPFSWAEWYSGRSLYYIPDDPKPTPKVRYVVWENASATPHSRLDRLPYAKDVKEKGQLVYHWPEDGPPEQATVHVYKTVEQ